MSLFDGRGSAWALGLVLALAAADAMADQVTTKAGVVEGFNERDGSVRTFRGIP